MRGNSILLNHCQGYWVHTSLLTSSEWKSHWSVSRDVNGIDSILGSVVWNPWTTDRIQHTSNLENCLDFEEEIFDEEELANEAISLIDEEIALDEAASEARYLMVTMVSNAAALYSWDNLLSHILSAIPRGLGRDEWLQALPRELVACFVKTDKEFQSKGGAVSELTVDHRLEENQEERERVKASGGEVGRLRILGGAEIGPLRCWPGGLCLSRSIGDMDVGEFIVPIPYVKQVKLSDAGGRLIIASDGIWDAVSSDMAAKSCVDVFPAELAAVFK
ncbi:probable protein phosphatase 2C 15 [Tanacetum coccineum]